MKKLLTNLHLFVFMLSGEQTWWLYYIVSTVVIWYVDNAVVLKLMACLGWSVAIWFARHCWVCSRPGRD